MEWPLKNDELKVYSPVDGKYIASVYQASEKDYEKVVKKAHEAFLILEKCTCS